MNFERLQHRVQRAEQLVEGRAIQTQTHWRELRRIWGEAWTPGRILVAGLVSGFLAGRAEPMKSMTGARWLQMIGSVSSLFASLQAATAADQANVAADTASEAADTAQAVQEEATGNPSSASAHQAPGEMQPPPPDPLHDVRAPAPAEAATDVSER